MVAFEIGVHYMERTQAVARSAMTGQAACLPLWVGKPTAP